jgi:hypothetical protein
MRPEATGLHWDERLLEKGKGSKRRSGSVDLNRVQSEMLIFERLIVEIVRVDHRSSVYRA